MEHEAPADGDTRSRVRALVAAQQDQLTRQGVDQEMLARQMRQVYEEFTQLRMHYQFGIDEVQTKVNILRQEFEQIHDYSPIEHVRSRLKSTESLIEKAVRTGGEMTIPAIRARIHDIAGVRITCSFVSDVYWIADMLSRQPDLEVLTVKDYIAAPKPNGYRSLHVIVQVPVFLSQHTEYVPVELQLRTIAMDFWASTEHKLSYKYEKNLPAPLRAELDDAARVAADLDERMERMRAEIRPMPEHSAPEPTASPASPPTTAPSPDSAAEARGA
ncbi:GTP pyrophosphokinase [Brachybacterium alimentarium]|uniref:GTP pyrophosphokinase n=1 Tax=Brachybacterium alimentarium TaxID=47845 RepID=UPI000DF19842|nr:GTP pyrophosphokinase family protein [Brachybacterium alimentarium]RCS66671.1 GTP pyrophosphokinase family protein [Brachybacterium alimentarium]RCS84692.1 GTP pyrophosphokinase family protein [Brachybacterium alimentarium]